MKTNFAPVGKGNTMTEREKLYMILYNIPGYVVSTDELVDYLLENGVSIPVRCKDCRMGEKYSNRPSYLFCMENHRLVAEDAFCSNGERAVNETD